MKIVPQGRPMRAEEGTAFFEEFIHHTRELCKKVGDEKKILAGGPISGTIGSALVVKADFAKKLDDLVTSVPVWPRMETAIAPLTTLRTARYRSNAGSVIHEASGQRNNKSHLAEVLSI